MSNHRLQTLAIALILAAIAPLVRADGPWTVLEERWYELSINGVKAGWLSEQVFDDGDRYRAVHDTRMQIERGSQSIAISMRTESIESHEGTLLEATSTERMSARTVITRWQYEKDHVLQSIGQGDGQSVKRLPLPEGPWLAPLVAERFAREWRQAGVRSYDYRTILPEQGLVPIVVQSERVGESTFDHDGRELPVEVWKTITEAMPIEAIEHYSSDGHLVYQEIQTGLGAMVTRLSSKEKAQQVGPGGGPELMVTMFVRPDRPIKDVLRSRRAVFRLRSKNGPLVALPSAGAQRVDAGEADDAAALHIDLDRNLAATPEELNDPSYLGDSAMVNARDPLVVKLARAAARGAGDDVGERAEAMRRLVSQRIGKKDLQIAFASAAETARTRQGDCSEHAVLLCAMLRAESIPARVATGLVYIDQFNGSGGQFGWHMWTQALIEGRWIDLDATLPVAFHAGHILTGVTSLADGAGGAELASILLLVGNIEVQVVEVGYGAPPNLERGDADE